MERRVVITGMGIWSCLGNTLDEVRDALYKGKSGIVFSEERKGLGFRSALCAKLEHPDLKPFCVAQLASVHARRGSICLYGYTCRVGGCEVGTGLY